jgi:hypothetical protein
VIKLRKKHFRKIAIDIAGFGLIILSPFAGLLPGPGGLPIFIAGLGILAINYDWAKRLVDNFEQKYNKFVEKYLINNRKNSLIVDILSVSIILIGIFTALMADTKIFTFFGIGMISFGSFILISNQNRLKNAIKKIKSINKS